jgi:two-component system, sensor histidine kinase and response regulator
MEPEKPHILIVDDNVKNLQVTSNVLKDSGYRISVAQDGVSALKQMDLIIPNLVLLDVMMPEMDGYEVCRRIKSDNRISDVPVIFLTAKNQPSEVLEGFKAGGVDYVLKPFNFEELKARVKTHVELAESRKKLLEMSQTRDKLYSIIAHDIRSPFASIVFMLYSLKSGLLEPGSSLFYELTDGLLKTVKDTQGLVENLLAWTKFHDGGLKLNFQKQNLVAVLAECIQFLEPVANQKSVKIFLCANEDCEAYFDEISILTVFRNLISNALKFSPRGETITVTVFSDANGCVVVQIKDNGVGMSENVKETIFEHDGFHSSEGTGSEKGTGLGLYLVKDFVSKNKGSIMVESEPLKGTIVTVRLPKKMPIG